MPLALEVVGPGERIVVVGAVGLDDQPLFGPAQVGDDAPPVEVQRLIDERMGEAVAQEQVEHGILELALGRRGAGRDDPRELGAAARGPGPFSTAASDPTVVSLRNCA